jgi:tetratricopeptide (TPR) repeat protein
MYPATRTLLLALVLLGASAGRAQAAEPASNPFSADDASLQDAYRKAIQEGVAEYDAHHFEEALGYFRNAHRLNPNARTFRGIGMTSFELRDYVTAMRNLLAALEDKRKPLSAEQRRETQELLERCRTFVARYTLTVSPASAKVTVDAKAAEYQPDGTILLGLGEHLIEARAEGYTKRSLSVQVRGGERNELFLTLDPIKPTLPLPPAPAGLTATTATAPPAVSNRAAKAWLWASAGAALLAAGAGVYWRAQASELSSCRSPQSGLRCTDEDVLVRQWNIGAAATIASGAAALTMATIGLLSWKSAPRSAPNRALACQVGVFALTCGRAF